MDIVLYSDDRALPSVLQRALGAEYTIRAISGEQELPPALAGGGVAALVLDLSRVEQGPAFCLWLRAETDLPVFAIAHPHDVHERVRLLRAGADDVVSWPFEIMELTARLRAKLRWFNTRQLAARLPPGTTKG
jgi:DNA-binding response OmpR family regulator